MLFILFWICVTRHVYPNVIFTQMVFLDASCHFFTFLALFSEILTRCSYKSCSHINYLVKMFEYLIIKSLSFPFRRQVISCIWKTQKAEVIKKAGR